MTGCGVIGLMTTVVAIPELVTYQLRSFVKEQEILNDKRFPKRLTLPGPKPGGRPCWEPPIFEYSIYEDVIKAHDNITAKEGKQGIEWRTELLEVQLEVNLLNEYNDWAKDMRDEVASTPNKGELSFYKALLVQVEQDLHIVEKEREDMGQKHGVEDEWYYDYLEKWGKEVNGVRIAPGASPLSEFESSSSSSSVSTFDQCSRSQSPGSATDGDGQTAPFKHTESTARSLARTYTLQVQAN